MFYDPGAHWLVYPILLKRERERGREREGEREKEAKERQMLFKKRNPRVCDGVCGSAVCLRSAVTAHGSFIEARRQTCCFYLVLFFCRRTLFFSPETEIKRERERERGTERSRFTGTHYFTASVSRISVSVRRSKILFLLSL